MKTENLKMKLKKNVLCVFLFFTLEINQYIKIFYPQMLWQHLNVNIPLIFQKGFYSSKHSKWRVLMGSGFQSMFCYFRTLDKTPLRGRKKRTKRALNHWKCFNTFVIVQTLIFSNLFYERLCNGFPVSIK